MSTNPYGVTLYSINTPSGSELHLQTQEEADWYENRRDRYMTDNVFTNVSDLQDLDRLLLLEVLIYRWGLWMAQGFDYLYARIDESQMKSNIKEYSVELRLVKASLGIDKATRDKDKGSNLAEYVENLLTRAKQFGYHRNDQYELVVTNMYKLRSLVTTYDRCDEEERRILDLSQDSIMDWIREQMIKPFDQQSEAFRKNQAMWIKDM